ncbi:MAG: M20/M25/M40 family metallo-hydrolase [Firmicutes bacterium]|nr:M20/M25/M40 family metallo-hydrolase [Bacillota bacterium]MBR4074192.1 M20/M25/M40 family metallo-hydrolase [Bacillota bacterium]
MRVEEILKDLVAIDTIRDNDNKQMMDYIEAFLKPYGFDIDRRKNETTGKEVLVGSFGDNATMGFLGHTDTVDITDGWETDPFTLTEKDGLLYGLGACDMKGGIAAALWAISQAPLDEIKAAGKGLKVYWTYDEEIMFGGIRDLVAGNEEFPPHVIIAEPTDLYPNIGSKGLLEWIINFKGVTTHSSAPIPGKNSNKNAVKFLSKMLELEEELSSGNYPMFAVPHTTMNIGIMKGGQAINKVPDKTTVYLDFRICDSENEQDKIRNTVEEALKEFDVEYEKINDIPSLLNRGERVGWYEEMTGKESCAGTGITEASFFGGDRVIIGPGPKTAHQKNECVSLESLEASAQLYLTAIKRECL